MRVARLLNLRDFARKPFRPPVLAFRSRMATVAKAKAKSKAKTKLEPTQLEPMVPPGIQKFQLRNYQEECIQAVLDNVGEGHRRMGVSLATGSGKTVIFTQLISRLTHPSNPLATQTLILVHRRELVEQAANHCRANYPDRTIEIEMSAAKATGAADITIASVQSLVSGDRIAKFDPKRFKLILIDEAHHAVASTYMQVLDHFGVLDPIEGVTDTPIVVGVSATLSRFDGMKLGRVMDRIVYHRDYVDMINDKWLSPVKFTTVKTNVDLSGVSSNAMGDFNTKELSLAVNTDEANGVTVQSWLEKAEKRKSTIVFCVDIQHVNDMVAKFRLYGIDARPVSSKTPAKERQQRLQEFKNGQFQVLVNCGIFTEGTDIPNVDCVLLARPTRSKNLLIQMIGRGMRQYPGKDDCHVLDMVGNVERGIVTVPTLFGLDPSEVVDEATIEDMEARTEEIKEGAEADAKASSSAMGNYVEGVKAGGVTFVDYDSVFDLIQDFGQEEVFIRRMSRLAWVIVDEDKYILTCGPNGYIKIERREEDENFQVVESRNLPFIVMGNPHVRAKPRVIVEEAESLETALRAADTYALKTYYPALLETRAPWRKGPPTEQQIKFLRKIKGKDENDDSWLKGVNKGKAGDMITKMRHGAMGRLEKIKRERKKLEKERDYLEKLRRKETVQVGDLL
ncbi:putative ATP-dependent helicase IRC3 [Rhizina undulata]